MLSVLSKERAGYAFYYELSDGENTFGGGMTEAGELVCDPLCTEKELLLRTLDSAFRARGSSFRRRRRACACRTTAKKGNNPCIGAHFVVNYKE